MRLETFFPDSDEEQKDQNENIWVLLVESEKNIKRSCLLSSDTEDTKAMHSL